MVREDPEVTEEMLSPSESLDSDEVRNADGDTVVDPPDAWAEADRFGVTANEQLEGESLESRLAEEEPDVFAEELVDDPFTDDAVVADVPIDGAVIDPELVPGRSHRGQISGTPEDGDSLFTVEE
jgi:hypothetical protein